MAFAALQRLGASALDLALTRAEFASVELAQTRAQLMRWLGLSLLVTMLAALALLSLSALAVVALWSSLGWITLLALALLYGLAGWLVLRRLQRELRDAAPLLSETLAELGRDRDALRSPASDRAPP